jgi:hypothetical protein
MYQGGVDPYLDFVKNSDRVALRVEYNF